MAWRLFLIAFVWGSCTEGQWIHTGTMELHGPSFVAEPPGFVDFSNSAGVRIPCAARGSPAPEMAWTYGDGSRVLGVPRLRHVLSNGTLVLPPFRAEDYRQDVHATVYRCRASNSVGVIVSRVVRIRAVVMQIYEVQVYDEFVITGNTAVLRCHIPSFVEDYVTVSSWIRNNDEVYSSPTKAGEKYAVMSTGELHVRNVAKNDGYLAYRCRTSHRLTGETKVSATSGRLIVTDPHSSIPPRITDSKQAVSARQGDTVILPCVGQGYPIPSYSWLTRNEEGKFLALPSGARIHQASGDLILENVRPLDSATYVCVVNNTVGSEKVETVLTVTAPLSATIQPPQHVVDLGKAVAFRCVTSGFPITSLVWLKDGREVAKDRVALVSREVLRVHAATRDDRGMYQCLVSNAYESVQAAVELRLGDISPILHAVFTDKVAQAGSSVALKCVVSGTPPPVVAWTLDDEPLASNERAKPDHYVDRDGNIVSLMNVSQVRVEDGGEYACIASNKVGKTQHVARLNVHGRPYIRPFRRKSVVAGEDVVIKCPYAGHPIEAVQWERGGRKLPIDHRQVVFLNGTLLVRSVQRAPDAGTYSCTVRSPDGHTATRDLEVMVRVPPTIMPFSFPDEQLHIGMRVRVVCVISQGDLPITVTWLKDGQPIPSELGVSVQNLDEYSSSLVIRSVTLAHNGNYTCLASNAAATASHTAQLHANVPPRWLVEPRDTEVMAGGRVLIDCQADGFPAPRLTWMKAVENVPGDYVEVPHVNSRVRQLDNGSLLVSEAKQEDRGRYSCRAANGVGTGLSHVIVLDVRVMAHFERKSRNVTIRLGAQAVVTCDAMGDGPLEITWYRESEKLTADTNPRFSWKKNRTKFGLESVLTISKAAGEDTGVYRCVARNIYGSDETAIYFTVTEPPSAPHSIGVVESFSRSATVVWTSPYDGNSPISKYIVQLKPSIVHWHERSINVTVGSSDKSAILRDLQPDSAYQCRVWAVNEAGHSPPSDVLSFTTTEEAPGGPPRNVKVEPTGSKGVKVIWQPPRKDTWNGSIRGYYVGYKVHDSSEPYTFKTVELQASDSGEQALSVEIGELKQFTKYGFIVQGYNQAGNSPRSDEVVVLTSEDVPSQPPEGLQCSAMSSQSVHVSWQAVASSAINGLLQGYKVVFQPAEEWYETFIPTSKVTTGLNMVLSGLDKYTNYSVQLLAYTRVGDGVRSQPVYCRTLEDVPDAPNDIKAVAMTLDSVMVSWKPPGRPNGAIKNYNIYIRALDHIKEEITKHTIPPTHTFYEAVGLKKNRRYEFWVTALTSVGEGQSTRVVSQSPAGPIVAAKIVSFGGDVTTSWRATLELPCRAVGIPLPDKDWKLDGLVLEHGDRVRPLPDGTLLIKHVHEKDAGAYSCRASNSYGTDEITYKLIVQVPPGPPTIFVTGITEYSLEIQWRGPTTGGSSIQGYTLYYKREFGEWEEVPLAAGADRHALSGLECGTKYQLYMEAHNKLGTGRASDVVSARTKGAAPSQPDEAKFLRTEATSATLFLNTWSSGGCPILYFVVQYKMLAQIDWKLVSNNLLQEQREFIIPDLSPATWHSLRVTAHNNAGSTVAEYQFATRTPGGGTLSPLGLDDGSSGSPFLYSWSILGSIMGILLVVFVVGLACVCCRQRKHIGANQSDGDQPLPADMAASKLLRQTPDKASSAGSFTYLLSTNNSSKGAKNPCLAPTAYTKKDNTTNISPYATAQITQGNEMKTFSQRTAQVYPPLRTDYRDGTFPRTRKEALQQFPRADGSMYTADYANPVTECDDPNNGLSHQVIYGSHPRVVRPSAPNMGFESHVPDLLEHGPESTTSNEDTSPEMFVRGSKQPDTYDRGRILERYNVDETRFIFNNSHENMRPCNNSQEVVLTEVEGDREHFYKEQNPSMYCKPYETGSPHRQIVGYPVQRSMGKEYIDDFTIAV